MFLSLIYLTRELRNKNNQGTKIQIIRWKYKINLNLHLNLNHWIIHIYIIILKNTNFNILHDLSNIDILHSSFILCNIQLNHNVWISLIDFNFHMKKFFLKIIIIFTITSIVNSLRMFNITLTFIYIIYYYINYFRISIAFLRFELRYK